MDDQRRPQNPYALPQQAQQQAGYPAQPGSPGTPTYPGTTGQPGPPAAQVPAAPAYGNTGYAGQGGKVGRTGLSVGTVLLWAGVVIGLFFVLCGAILVIDSPLTAVGGLLLGLGIALPCAWPLRCRNRDRTALATWEKEQASNRELARFLTDAEDAAIAASLAPTPPPAPSPRRWAPVAGVTAVLLVLAMVFLGLGDETLEESDQQNSVGAGSGE